MAKTFLTSSCHFGVRRCHECGEATTNYLCDYCRWKYMRKHEISPEEFGFDRERIGKLKAYAKARNIPLVSLGL